MTKAFTAALVSLTVLSMSLSLSYLMYLMDVHGSLNEDIVTPPPQGNKT